MKNPVTSRTIKTLGAIAAGGIAFSAAASAQIVIQPATTAFTDISTTGTSPGSASDDSELNITMAALSAAGFTGNELLPLANIRMGNNGAVLWHSTAGEIGYINSTTLPSMAASNLATTGNGGSTVGTSMLCPLWDDNTPVTAAAAQRWQVIGGNLILQWTNEDHFNATGVGSITYEAIIYGGATIASGAPLVDFVYQDTLYLPSQYQNDGGSATIGYKNWSTVAAANDVEFGIGGGTDTLADPTFGGTNMQPKVGGYVANNDPTLPHAVRIQGNGTAPISSFCPGDGTGTACPCGNNAAVGSGTGCLHSLGTGGLLTGAGNPSIANDTFSLNGTGMPSSSALYFQGTTAIGGGAGAVFGDGIRCAGGTVLRLGTKTNVGGSSSYPGGSTPISIRGANVAGNVRVYQCWYRNAAAFCTVSTFNLTNGVQCTWQP